MSVMVRRLRDDWDYPADLGQLGPDEEGVCRIYQDPKIPQNKVSGIRISASRLSLGDLEPVEGICPWFPRVRPTGQTSESPQTFFLGTSWYYEPQDGPDPGRRVIEIAV